MLRLLSKLFPQKVTDKSEKQRLAVALKERPLREVFNEEHWQSVKRAREWSDLTIGIREVKK